MKFLIIATTLISFLALTAFPTQPAFAGFEMDGEGNVEEKKK